MLQTILSWFGGYVLLGLVWNFIIDYEEIIDYIKSDEKRNGDFEKIAGTCVVTTAFWPIIPPILVWMRISDWVLDRFKRKVDSKVYHWTKLMHLLVETEAVDDETAGDAIDELNKLSSESIRAKRKKLKML